MSNDVKIKKAYQPIVDFLEQTVAENPRATVKSIMAQVIELSKAAFNRNMLTSIKDAQGNVVALFDYYFKRWMPVVGPNAVEFGTKAGTSTGFNNMSKEGLSIWTKQQREAKNAEQALLGKVASGEILPTDIVKHQEEIEAKRKEVVSTDKGFATVEEVIEHLTANGFEPVAPAAGMQAPSDEDEAQAA